MFEALFDIFYKEIFGRIGAFTLRLTGFKNGDLSTIKKHNDELCFFTGFIVFISPLLLFIYFF